jgi:virginiamycin A acetyltransferase
MGNFFFLLYKIQSKQLRKLIVYLVRKLENDEFYSTTLRRIYNKYLFVDIGMYTGRYLFNSIDPHTTIGRYCSIAYGVRIINHNHPIDWRSTHPFFFNSNLSFSKIDHTKYIPITIGHDVWIGHNAIITPNVTKIGTGSIVAAGAVVTKDIPPYAIVVGNPARIVRYRFPQKVIDFLLTSKWWEKSINEIHQHEFDSFQQNYVEFLKQNGMVSSPELESIIKE